jgi:hypothetical protein
MAWFSHALAGVRWWFRFQFALASDKNIFSSVHIPLHLFHTSAALVHINIMEKNSTACVLQLGISRKHVLDLILEITYESSVILVKY